MSKMGDTLTDYIPEKAKKALKKKSVYISGSVIVAIGLVKSVFDFFGINPLDVPIMFSPAYEKHMERREIQIEVLEDDIRWLRRANETLRDDVSHLDHYIESQNLMARKLLDAGVINMDTYDRIYHAVEHHEGDTL